MSSATTETVPAARLRDKYEQEVRPALREQFGYSNPMMVPKLLKVTINMGVGKAIENKKRLEHAGHELATIAAQKPVVDHARVCAVTLRGRRMWEFVDRLISVAVPRIRDFRGLPTRLDGQGNYSMGLSEQSVFPEINLDKVEFVQGMHITFVTSARTDEEGLALLTKLGMPFVK